MVVVALMVVYANMLQYPLFYTAPKTPTNFIIAVAALGSRNFASSCLFLYTIYIFLLQTPFHAARINQK